MENLNLGSKPFYKKDHTPNNLGYRSHNSVSNSHVNPDQMYKDYTDGRFASIDYLTKLESKKPGPRNPIIAALAKPLLLKMLDSAPGEIVISDTNGEQIILGKRDGPRINLEIKNNNVFGLTLLNRSTGLGVAYANGYFECNDLTQFLQLITTILIKQTGSMNKFRTKTSIIGNRFRGLTHSEDKQIDRSQIHFHYDLSNEFFELMLDETMSYSCGVFLKENDTLKSASENKMQKLIDMLQLKATDHLLEIGSGWGGLAVFAANKTGCKVTTTTTSEQQEIYVKQRVAKLNLQDNIQVLDKDFRDLSGKFDKLVSVEMIEALD